VYESNKREGEEMTMVWCSGLEVLSAYLNRGDHVRLSLMNIWDFADYVIRLVEVQLATSEYLR
jgi:hypothetical protein